MTPREIRRESEPCFVYYIFHYDKYNIEGTYKECLQFVEEEYKHIKK
jgi:hypothetical protein